METRRVYIVGAGAIAMAHAEAVSRLSGGKSMEIHAADPSEAARGRFAETFAQARLHDSAEAMLAGPAEPGDIVIVATPPAFHAEMTTLALASGRHTLCEKPLAMDMGQARAMLEAARKAERLLGCCSSRFLGQSAGEALKGLLAAGRLGRLYHVDWHMRIPRSRSGIEYQPQTPWFVQKARSGGGVLMDWSPYDFSTLNDLLQPVRVDVRAAWTARPDAHADLPPGIEPDVEFHAGAAMLYHLPDGRTVPVTFERASCTHGRASSASEFLGEDGAAMLDWLGDGLSITTDNAGKPATEALPTTTGSLSPHDKPLVYFHEAIHGRPSLAVVNERAVFNFGCIQAIYAAAGTGAPQTVEMEG